MLLLLRSTRTKLAGRFRSSAPMAIILLEAIDNDLTFGYSFSALAGTWVSVLLSKLMVSTSCRVVFGTLVRTLVNVDPSDP